MCYLFGDNVKICFHGVIELSDRKAATITSERNEIDVQRRLLTLCSDGTSVALGQRA